MPEYILPHEVSLLEASLGDLSRQMRDLADEKAEAQGAAFDWHDNAPLDAVEQEQGIVGGRRNAAMRLLREATRVPYPDPQSNEVALGSLVSAEDQWGPMAFLLVGQRLVGQEGYRAALAQDLDIDPVDISVVTPASPLGAAALGATVGQRVEYALEGERTAAITIQVIDQEWIVQRFAID